MVTSSVVNNAPHRIHILFPGVTTPLEIPVLPDSMAGSIDGVLKTFDAVSLGEVLSIGGRKLETIQWQSFFPFKYDFTTNVASPDATILPEIWLANFKKTMDNQEYLHISVENTSIDMDAAVSSFKWSYIPGDMGDLWYQIALIERKQGAIRLFDGTSFPSLAIRSRPTKLPTHHVVLPGQTFQDISVILYGSPDYAGDLYHDNYTLIIKNSDDLAFLATQNLQAFKTGVNGAALFKAADIIPTGIDLTVRVPAGWIDPNAPVTITPDSTAAPQ